MSNNYNLRYNFINVCSPDYLQDHHTREGEQLIAVDYYGGMDYRDLANDIAFEVMAGSDYTELWGVLPTDNDQAQMLLRQLVIDEVDSSYLEISEDSEDLMVYGYFSWDVD